MWPNHHVLPQIRRDGSAETNRDVIRGRPVKRGLGRTPGVRSCTNSDDIDTGATRPRPVDRRRISGSVNPGGGVVRSTVRAAERRTTGSGFHTPNHRTRATRVASPDTYLKNGCPDEKKTDNRKPRNELFRRRSKATSAARRLLIVIVSHLSPSPPGRRFSFKLLSERDAGPLAAFTGRIVTDYEDGVRTRNDVHDV